MKDVLDRLLTGKVTEKTITNIREMVQDSIDLDANPRSLESPINETLLYGAKAELEKGLAGKIIECMCAGAFGTMVPDHAVSIVDSGPGGKIKTSKKSLYDYADPKDFLHECVDKHVDENKMVNKILYIINDVKKYGERSITDMYTNGYCYDFAIMIWRNVRNSRIFFDTTHKHYLVEYQGRFFDISGEVKPNIRYLEEDDYVIKSWD